MKSLFALFLLLCLTISCGSKKNSLKIGDKAVVVKQCMATDTEENYELMTEISVRKDEPALMRMVAAGSVYVINESTIGTIRDVKFGRYLFEYTPALEPVRVWVTSDFVE